jgi:hypothetical protein
VDWLEMFKGFATAFNLALFLVFLLSIYCANLVPLAWASEVVMEVRDVLFAFGWSANAGDQWLVNGEIIILNSKALVLPPSAPIEGDAGPVQTNLYVVYLNNIQFSHGWSSNVSDRYSPSTSMIVGSLSSFNSKAFIEPSIPSDAGPHQQNLALIYLNNIGFHFAWSPNPEDRYSASTTMNVGPLTPLNPQALKVPPSWAIGIDTTPPLIDVPTREPSGDVMPDQPVKVLVAVTDTESGVKNVTLAYTVNNGTSWFDIPMVYNETTSKYEATIPGQPKYPRDTFIIIWKQYDAGK